MSRKLERQKNRKKEMRSTALRYGAIPLVAAFILPLAVGGAPLGAHVQEASKTAHQVAAADAQSYVASSSIVAPALTRSNYSATSAEEVAAVVAAREAAAEEARKKEEQERLRAQAASLKSSSFTPKLNYSMVAAGSGEIRWPLPGGSWQLGSRLGDGRNHQGVDMVADEGTPIYAAAAGTVKVAQNAYSAYGTAVVLVHNIGGQQVTTLYAHMPLNSNVVNVGDTVEAGQLIGYVGNTGRSYGAHLHLEVRLNGGIIDGYDWLTANAG